MKSLIMSLVVGASMLFAGIASADTCYQQGATIVCYRTPVVIVPAAPVVVHRGFYHPYVYRPYVYRGYGYRGYRGFRRW